MKKLRKTIDDWLDHLDERWRRLSLKQQQRYVLYIFIGYLLLTVAVILKVCFDVAKPGKAIKIEHIRNPVIRKQPDASRLDSLSKIIKKELHGK